MARRNRVTLLKAACAASLALLTLTGCEQYRARRDSVSFEHGNAVAHNIAVQTVDPWPPQSKNSRIDIDGERQLIAIERYKANKSIPPRGLATQTINVQSSGAGSQ